MRSNATQYAVASPASLAEALSLLQEQACTPLAGGTELMVAFAAGRLQARRLLSLHRVNELRFVEVAPDSVTIGAGATFTDLRRHPVITEEFPVLSQAAGWIGSIANQNRATLGGNIVNASPAADAPPALLVYDAEVTLVSAAGTRTLPYTEFHLAYKKTVLAPEELLFSLRLKRSYQGYVSYLRKVGARNAQAISKVALAALGRVEAGAITDVRLAAASLAETPLRLYDVERVLLHQGLGARGVSAKALAEARSSLASVARPIDDIRSTALYRSAVAANLLEAFLGELARSPGAGESVKW